MALPRNCGPFPPNEFCTTYDCSPEQLKNITMRTEGAACITCREKCRRCDRTRPVCQRCESKGLHCKGYPDKFRFISLSAQVKRKTHRARTQSKSRRSLPPTGSPINPSVEDETTQSCVFSPDNSVFEASPAFDQLSPPEHHQTEDPRAELNNMLMLKRTESLLTYCACLPGPFGHSELCFAWLNETRADDREICPHQIALAEDSPDNPYRLFVLPLSYEHLGLLYAVLGLTACHMGTKISDVYLRETLAVEYRLKAIRSLSDTIKKVIAGDLHEDFRDSIFATIQILLLQDICESGISIHGVHITGALSVCNQLRLCDTLSWMDERTIFFLGNLAWLDVIRALADPQRLCFSPELRETIATLSDLKFEQVNGCPRQVFLIIGNVLEYAKAHAAGEMDTPSYERLLEVAQHSLYSWRLTGQICPKDDLRWRAVAEAFRHACILHTCRLLDVSQPAETAVIQQSVTAILDAVSEIPPDCYLLELLVMPLFMAGTEALSRHSRHYILLRLDHIKARAGFGNPLPNSLLKNVWDARSNQLKKDCSNISWMSFTRTTATNPQHDYLIL